MAKPRRQGPGFTTCQDSPVSTAAPARPQRVTAVMREESRVTPLELFFDLVFVLALTQCTALMADEPTWEGLGQGAARARRCCGGRGAATPG